MTDSRIVARDLSLALESFRVFVAAASRLGITDAVALPPKELAGLRVAITELCVANGIVALPALELVTQWRLDEHVGPMAVRKIVKEIAGTLNNPRAEAPPAGNLEHWRIYR